MKNQSLSVLALFWLIWCLAFCPLKVLTPFQRPPDHFHGPIMHLLWPDSSGTSWPSVAKRCSGNRTLPNSTTIWIDIDCIRVNSRWAISVMVYAARYRPCTQTVMFRQWPHYRCVYSSATRFFNVSLCIRQNYSRPCPILFVTVIITLQSVAYGSIRFTWLLID